MAEKKIESIVDALKEIIDQNSPKHLTDEPYRVYAELIESGSADRKTAAALLHFLVSGMLDTADLSCEVEQLSGAIRRECSLNKKMADRLAIILNTLYSQDNKREWRCKDLKGLSQFMKEEFLYKWKGFAVWDEGNGTVDCHYEARIRLKTTETISEDKELVALLARNPFTPKEVIHDLFAKRLQEYLSYEFEEYCTEDDYYPPVVEDFGSNMEYALPEWSKENGFEFVSWEGDGDDGGYEPKFRKGWY